MQTFYTRHANAFQDARREREHDELDKMRSIGLNNPEQAALLDPADFGFVCSIDTLETRKIINVFANPRRKAAV